MKDIAAIILEQIECFNETLDNKVDVTQGSESVLFGQGSSLESVDFVSLIVDIEQAVNDEFDTSITLVDAYAMSQKHSPFRTVGTLAEYIKGQLREADHE